ncbi:MAG: putative CXXCH cytochrome family protein [Planctomycetota bacterium]|jgi:predicted CXXCH cytochrome family protein
MLFGLRLTLCSLLAVSGVANPTPQAVDDARCIDCHPLETKGWRAGGMAHALGPIEPGEFEGLGTVVEAGTGFSYRFEEGGGAARLLESYVREGAQPKQSNSWPVAFAIGAGELDRSYALEVDRRWWYAPLEVLAGKSSEAVLAPPHTMSPGSRASLPVTPECLACHTDNLPPMGYPLNRSVDARVWEPRGISCGACHADALAHADWREDDLSGEELAGGDPLLSHDSFTREQRMSTCASCHLQGDARIELEPNRFGIPRAGNDVLEQRAIFVAAKPGPEVGFVSQVERLVLSRCYLEPTEAEGAMSCETCHNPHQSVFVERERRRVRAACVNCHATGNGAASAAAMHCALPVSDRPDDRDCVDCHMPKVPVFDVDAVRIHDHWIRTEPQAPEVAQSLRADESPAGDWKRFLWPGVDPPAHANDPGLDMLALFARGHVEAAQALIDSKPGSRTVRLPMYHHVRAGLLEQLGRIQEAHGAYRVALALDPTLAPATTNLGLLLTGIGRGGEAIELLSKLLEGSPGLDGALRNRALAHASVGDMNSFARDLEEAFRLRPVGSIAQALAQHFEGLGETSRAARWRAAAQRTDPRIKQD